jgi:parallel beta-helix repeat protein
MKTTFAALLLLALAPFANAGEFHVALKGSDATGDGSAQRPFATLEKARDAARVEPGSTVLVHGGTYYREQPLMLTPADSGLTIKAFEKETPVVVGGLPVTGWKKLETEPSGVVKGAQGKLWVADIPKGWCPHFLYVDGAAMPRAKLHNGHWRSWPVNFTRGSSTLDGQPVTFKSKDILKNIPGNGDVEMVCIMAQYGVMGNGVLTKVDAGAGTAVWNSTQTELGFRTRDPNRFTLENALPFIDKAGEWAVDSTAGKIYLWPESGDLASAKVVAPKAYELIRFQGDATAQKWVEKVTVSGLTLICTDRLPENQWSSEWICRQWEHPDAMVYFQGAKDCALTGNRLLNSGSTGVSLDQFCQGVRVEGNEIGRPGSDGVLLCGYGPGTLDVNRDNVVSRNWIHDMGQGNYWHSAGVQIYQSGHNRITGNLIQRSAYCGISIVGAKDTVLNNPNVFFRDNPADAGRQFKEWGMYGIRSQDFPEAMRDAVKAGKKPFNRETAKPYLHSRENLVEGNIVVEAEQLLDEGGAIYAYWCGKGNVWKDNLVFKSSGMPGSSILALDEVSEYFTITGNVIWVNGKAGCGTIGMRADERGNVIHDNIRAAVEPAHRDAPHWVGVKRKFHIDEPGRESVYKLQQQIVDKVVAAGGWPGNPDTGIPKPGEAIKDAKQRTMPKGSHKTIE